MGTTRKLFLITFFCLIFFEVVSTVDDDNNTSTAKTIELFKEVQNETEVPPVVLTEDEELLKKWRDLDMLLKDYSQWAVKMAMPTILRFQEEIAISPKCTNSIMKMIYGVKKMKLWAFQMLDSSGKIPNGAIGGFLSSLGDYDGCLDVEVPGSNPFQGKYCTVLIQPPLPKRKHLHNVWEVLPEFVNLTKDGTILNELIRFAPHFYYVQIRTSVCLPSTCSDEDVNTIIAKAAAELQVTWDIYAPYCDTKKPVVFSNSDITIMCVLCFIGFLALSATITDIVLVQMKTKENQSKQAPTSTALQSLLCFSMYTNTLRLLKKDDSEGTIKIFHGMKVVTIFWVIMNHTYYYTNFNLCGSLRNARFYGKEIPFQVIANGFLNVETFFFISAVLLSYGRMKFTGKHISVPLYIFRRVWRLTPPLMLVIMTSMLIPHMGDGPGWQETMVALIDKCKANWWTNLIFINNFISSDHMCFQWLWYIPVDTHLYLMALLVIVPLKSRPRLALGINTGLFILGTIVSAASHVYYEQPPTAMYIYSIPQDINYYTDNSYFRSYTHITTCCIGLYVGYILATRPKLKIPTGLNILGWLVSVTLGLLVVYGVYDWNQGNMPSLAVSTLYNCTNKVAFALALGYVTIACYTGNGGFVTSLLSWQGLVPFSRLTYVAYLIHPILQFMFVASTRVPIQMDHRTNVRMFLSNIVMSFSFAYLLSLLFESPFMCLEKVMFSSRRPPAKATPEKHPEENGKFGLHNNGFDNSVSTINIKKIESDVP